MKLAYVTTYDSRTIGKQGLIEWSGTGYYIAKSLKKQFIPIEFIGPLKNEPFSFVLSKTKRNYYEFCRQTYLKVTEPLVLKNYARQVAEKLAKTKADIVFSASVNPIAYLKCEQPIVFWADATFANLVDFYPQYSNLCQESLERGHLMERLALEKSSLAIYSSEWAAQTAIEYYKADSAKVRVVPFGANIESRKTIDEIKDSIESRPSDRCKLLFLGVDWYRKGGDVALEVAQKLNDLGLNTELTLVGSQPVVEGSLPSFVKSLGFISKSSQKGKAKIDRLIAESHFLIMPSLADCSPIVLCEANSRGVPCLSTQVGGIPSIIKNGINGKLFHKNSSSKEYCEYIYNLFMNYSQYKSLAFSAFDEYETRLNWKAIGHEVKKLLMTL